MFVIYKEGRDLKTERWVERGERLRKEKNSYGPFTKAHFKAKYRFSKNSELLEDTGGSHTEEKLLK